MTPVDRDRLNGRILGELLVAVDGTADVSQRQLSKQLGIALGLVNFYVKRCVKKGWIKVSHAPPRRFAYYLTPQGFAEKSRLTAEFLNWSLQYFKRARIDCSAALNEAAVRGWVNIGLIGGGELAEIAVLCSAETGPRVVAVVDASWKHRRVGRVPVFRGPEDVGQVDGWILTTLQDAQAAYDSFAERLDPSRILVPRLLSVRTTEGSSNWAPAAMEKDTTI